MCHKNENILTCLILSNPPNSCLCKTCAHVTPAQFGPRLKCLRLNHGAQSKTLIVNALNYRHATVACFESTLSAAMNWIPQASWAVRLIRHVFSLNDKKVILRCSTLHVPSNYAGSQNIRSFYESHSFWEFFYGENADRPRYLRRIAFCCTSSESHLLSRLFLSSFFVSPFAPRRCFSQTPASLRLH